VPHQGCRTRFDELSDRKGCGTHGRNVPEPVERCRTKAAGRASTSSATGRETRRGDETVSLSKGDGDETAARRFDRLSD
jgi:hypothetical protein